MHQTFDSNKISFEKFFSHPQHGSGAYFEGLPFQRGFGHRQYGQGIGTVFSNFWRFISPVLISAGKALGQEGLATGARILTNISQGQNFKNVAQQEATQGIKNLVKKTHTKLNQQGEGAKKKKKRPIVGRQFSIIPSKQKRDIFDNI